jgi:hypothetical protein
MKMPMFRASPLVTALYNVTICNYEKRHSNKNPSFTKKGPGRKHRQGKGK